MDAIENAQQLLRTADAILISASNGLSISEGYNIFANNAAFHRYFGEFSAEYGITSILQGAQAYLPKGARRAFMAKLHQYLIDDYHGADQFRLLKQLVGERDYFVITSNADQHFQLNGFEPHRLWEIEGNFFGLRMQSPEWQAQQQACQDFLQRYADKNLVQLELGIGAANQLIKQPLMEMVAAHPRWHYLTLNLPTEINIPAGIADRSLALPGDLKKTLTKLVKEPN
ncbi:hypothetical protein [Limosilactobacillus sp.]|jgi:NAD-dependent SIR2 family protein deacetylase|uniref:hypothetical protein n=1 Tax=Limosilactobacillus sp. TaxID=2773925 RepID=UPI0025B7E008|nr:hypothetical protein [Limosilactobacillus sp.]MCH3921577.1 hypothetical protein [Limosilactobacillus sp.]MCH3928348.1 hypothetical protein [Limosilactobacillus sp.]